ncbi:MAG TPA: PilX N-terminal domain-containing pilus assembly protein [Steroidobacteraceae bacterium]|jgi:type IV pilus assembly protein PilX
MKQSLQRRRSDQRGIVLVASLLLLLIVTVMALSIFRSFGIQEKIAGNMREKQHALQAANSTQQYAEWWLANQSPAPRAVAAGIASAADVQCSAVLDANLGQGQICLNSLVAVASLTPNAGAWPASGANVGVLYTPTGLNFTGNVTNSLVTDVYYARPRFYISDVGPLASGRGEVYQVDAYSYGLGSTAVAEVESTVAITCQVCNVGGL